VTYNSTRVRIGYRIYSLRRFTAATQVTITMITLALLASHCEGSLRGLIAPASGKEFIIKTLAVLINQSFTSSALSSVGTWTFRLI
jgi:hypothetical protein